jgi:hypothetical protein
MGADPRSARRRLHGVYLRELIEKLDPLDMGTEMDVGLRCMVDRRLHARQGGHDHQEAPRSGRAEPGCSAEVS